MVAKAKQAQSRSFWPAKCSRLFDATLGSVGTPGVRRLHGLNGMCEATHPSYEGLGRFCRRLGLLREQIGQVIRARTANFINLSGQHERACL
jgi:hypothetical protein